MDTIRVRTFDVVFSIIGGGEEGNKHAVRTKEEADHSLPYMVAVALLDGEVTPAQYAPDRITAQDVQSLLSKVEVVADPDLSARFPEEMPADVEVTATDGTVFRTYQATYEGFHTDPMSWASARAKFDRLAAPVADRRRRDEMAQVIGNLEDHPVAELTRMLSTVGPHER